MREIVVDPSEMAANALTAHEEDLQNGGPVLVVP